MVWYTVWYLGVVLTGMMCQSIDWWVIFSRNKVWKWPTRISPIWISIQVQFWIICLCLKKKFYKKSIKSKKDDLSLWSRRKRNNGNLGDKNGSMKFQIDANEKLKCGTSLISPPFSYQLATWFRRRIIFEMLDTCLQGHEIGIFIGKRLF